MRIFISHATEDDEFVRRLRQALAEHGQPGWIDSRELRGGDPLWESIRAAIEQAAAFAVVVSPAALQSRWVGKELRHALTLQQQRGRDAYPVIPLAVDGTKLGVLEQFFDDPPTYIAISTAAGGLEAALDQILSALGKRLPADPALAPRPTAEPIEELVLELTDLGIQEKDGTRRATARARLIYEPATAGRREVKSERSWRLTAPIGPIEAGELRWYLEQYAIWPGRVFAPRARQVEQDLIAWGRLLHDAALPAACTGNVLQAWAGIDARAGRRFSVLVDATPLSDATDDNDNDNDNEQIVKEAATLLLGLPWELLHDGKRFLFQGAAPTRVRRRLPNTQGFAVPVVAAPIRILLISPRPEDDACGFIDHRISARPLVEAMEALPGLVRLHLLTPPTLPALRAELDRARAQGEPYQVVHFDGHGVYDRRVGLGGLCFERPEDDARLDHRDHQTIHTDQLGPLLYEHRIPLVFLEACQSAQAEQASESVASELLKVGVAAVVAMSHSVLVETARRFVGAFYRGLSQGQRIGDAMLAGQRALADDDFRGQVFGADALRLKDWFVPVLFQERDDPQLFTAIPAPQTLADVRERLRTRLGQLPPEPATGFIGRSRDLLALERLLFAPAPPGAARYAVIRGQGGEGKTALAAELARWSVRSGQVERAAFVCVEGLEVNLVETVLDRLGGQLIQAGFSTAVDCQGDLYLAEQQIARVLREQATLLLLDNLESILPPPYLARERAAALADEADAELDDLLALCRRLLDQGQTRLVFTSREQLLAPFDAARHRRELHRLHRDDAVKLIERVLNADLAGTDPDAPDRSDDAARDEIEQLVDACAGHARTLTLLAPHLRQRGVAATRVALVELMAEMARRFPADHPQAREQSVFASVELSLQRLSAANRERAAVLGVFHGGVQLDVLRMMMDWELADCAALASDLVETGLATANPRSHLSLSPALCPYLATRLETDAHAALTERWVAAMRHYVGFLDRQLNQSAELSATLTWLELPALFALLEQVEQAGDAAATIELATAIYQLLQHLGKPRLLARLGKVRDAATEALDADWGHAAFQAVGTRIEQQLNGGALPTALEDARELLARVRRAGEGTYPLADYDLALACFQLGRVLKTAGGAAQALPLLAEAERRFEAIRLEQVAKAAERMASVCINERGDCLLDLGRFDDAAAAYEEAIRRGEARGAERDVAVGKGQLGTVRLRQQRFDDALAAYREAIERFTALKEPGTAAGYWHQTGMAYQEAGAPKAAEDAYRRSLEISVRLGDVAKQAATLGQLSQLYNEAFDRTEEAVTLLRQAADKFVEIGDQTNEGRAASDLANCLHKLRRLNDARQVCRHAIACKAGRGHAPEPWKTWDILAAIETDAGTPDAAAAARAQARATYLAYRRDGGENHNLDGRLALDVSTALRIQDADSARALLWQARERTANHPEAAQIVAFLNALQDIANGSRDRALADAPDLSYSSAAEIDLLLDALAPPAPT